MLLAFFDEPKIAVGWRSMAVDAVSMPPLSDVFLLTAVPLEPANARPTKRPKKPPVDYQHEAHYTPVAYQQEKLGRE